MRILVACEESQTVTKELRLLGHDAYSCDILECSGGHPEWHIQGDAIDVAYGEHWDMMIAHPPCTYLAVSGARWLYNKDGSRNEERWRKKEAALKFVRALMDAPIDKIAIENPISMISSEIRKPEQIIQPWQFGHQLAKATCLWLKNLPKLQPTNVVEPEYVTSGTGRRWSKWFWETSLIPYKERGKARSKTFEGIAKAIAEQWAKI
jgi:hypothetical protein